MDDDDSTQGRLAVASANGAQVRFFPLPGAVTGPTPGVHAAGELYADKDGTLWFTVPTATAGVVRFVKLAGTPTSGSFHSIDPQGVYDSRQPGYAAALRGVMAPNTNRVISVADGRSENGTPVPAAANAVRLNATAVHIKRDRREHDRSQLRVGRGRTQGHDPRGLSDQLERHRHPDRLCDHCPVDASRQITVYCGNQTGSAHVIIDVYGYYP